MSPLLATIDLLPWSVVLAALSLSTLSFLAAIRALLPVPPPRRWVPPPPTRDSELVSGLVDGARLWGRARHVEAGLAIDLHRVEEDGETMWAVLIERPRGAKPRRLRVTHHQTLAEAGRALTARLECLRGGR